jgi:endonuclease YncB( thermonuclease family)
MAWFVVIAAFGCGDADPAPANGQRGEDGYATGDALANNPTGDDGSDTTPTKSDDPTEKNTPDDDDPSEVVELPSIPYELDELPAGATAPWPGDMVHGALVEVAHVIDGDTIKVELADGKVPVRLVGINAPECDKRPVGSNDRECDPDAQDLSGEAEVYGVEAWQALRDRLQDQTVRIACKEVNGRCETDRYGRFLGYIVLDGEDMAEFMTSGGHAWTYTQFPPDNIYTYCVAEDSAIANGEGMWAEGFDSVVTGMNASTRHWYAYRDSTCEENAP